MEKVKDFAFISFMIIAAACLIYQTIDRSITNRLEREAYHRMIETNDRVEEINEQIRESLEDETR